MDAWYLSKVEEKKKKDFKPDITYHKNWHTTLRCASTGADKRDREERSTSWKRSAIDIQEHDSQASFGRGSGQNQYSRMTGDRASPDTANGWTPGCSRLTGRASSIQQDNLSHQWGEYEAQHQRRGSVQPAIPKPLGNVQSFNPLQDDVSAA